MISICSVMRELELDSSSEMGKRVAWSAGARVRDLWTDEHETRPEMRLVPKANGGGSHDKAVYPSSWRERIEDAIRAAELELGAVPDPRQTGLFG